MAAASGVHYSVLLTERGGLMIFGTNNSGQLGRGNRESQLLPALLGGVGPVVGDALEDVPGSGALQAARALDIVPWEHQVAEPWEQQDAEPHPFGGEALLAVAAGHAHTVCVTDGGAVYAAGTNFSGELGLGDLELHTLFARVPLDAEVQMVACGCEHTLALTRAGEVWAWGSGNRGQNGQVSTQNQSVPAHVAGMDVIVMVAAGNLHSVAIGTDGRVWTWGDSSFGALGHDDTDEIPFPAPRVLGPPAFGGDAVVFVAAGNAYTAAVTVGGALWAWGAGDDGQLGLGDSEDRRVPARITHAGPPPAWGGSPVRMVSCSGCRDASYTLAVTEDGAVWSWGSSSVGALGYARFWPGNFDTRVFPTRIPQASFDGARIVFVCAGHGGANVAVCKHGLVHVWGSARLHGLAYPQYADAPTPLPASVFPGARCGRSGGLSRQHTVAFMQGLHARLGALCLYNDSNNDVITCVVAQGRVLNEPYKHMREGLRRLLAVDLRET